MSDGEQLSGSIEDFVLGMADSLASAQRRLAEQIVWLPNGQTVIYQVPRLDFELQVGFDLETVEAAGSSSVRLRAVPGGSRRRTATEINSTIRGSFVAVPLTGLSAPPRLRVTEERVSMREVRLIAQVTRDAELPVAGATVRFGIDGEVSGQLNPATLSAGTMLNRAEATTDAAGVAEVRLEIDEGEPVAHLIAVKVSVNGTREIIIVGAGQ